MRHRIALVLMLLPLLALETACSGIRRPTRRTNSALDFLYPHQSFVGSQPAQDVVLQLPVRVGLAFAPNQNEQSDPITEEEKQVLLNRVAAAFKAHQEIGSLKVVPSPYLEPGGSFPNLDQIRASLGVDLIVLLSYDQEQFTDRTRASSLTYFTIVGPLLIDGEKNETRTVIDAVIYDIRSRALLFRAAGDSAVKGRSSLYNVDRKRRRFAAEGFAKATDHLIASLDTALAQFQEQALQGTVQGPGTPAIAMYDPHGKRITPRRESGGGGGGGGGGAFGFAELSMGLLLGLALLSGLRRPARGR